MCSCMDESTIWPDAAERLLESVPGVASASLVGDQQAVEEVHLVYEPDRPVGEILDAVHTTLEHSVNARLSQARVHMAIARPAVARPRRWGPPVRTSSGSLDDLRLDGGVGFVAYHVRTVRPGVIRVEVQVECMGRMFSGSALGRTDSPGGQIRIPALATLSALDACLQNLYRGVGHPVLALESMIVAQVAGTATAIVGVTASEKARPIPLTAAWPLAQNSDQAAILAILQAAGRTVSGWIMGDDIPLPENDRGASR